MGEPACSWNDCKAGIRHFGSMVKIQGTIDVMTKAPNSSLTEALELLGGCVVVGLCSKEICMSDQPRERKVVKDTFS